MQNFIFNPFHRIAGLKALGLGFLIIVITALFAFLFNTHFPGLLDIKYGYKETYGFLNFLSYGIVNLMSMSVFIYLAGLLLSKSSVRFIDVIGTQTLARAPLLLAPFLNTSGLIEKGGAYLLFKYLEHGHPTSLSRVEFILFIFFTLLMILLIAWMITLMYNAYKVSCNVKGSKAVVSFIIIIFLVEILTLYLNHLAQLFLLNL